MKKLLKCLAITILTVCALCTSAFAVKLNVNGVTKELAAYNIKGNNYFKLRDMAEVLNGTSAQFDVTWDETNKAINLLSKTPYSSKETLDAKTVPNAVARANNSAIYLNGAKVIAGAYNIEGNNYFKLRDIAALLDVAVTYDASTKLIGIDTSKKYEFPSSDGAMEVNPEAVSYIGKGVAVLEERYGKRIPYLNYYKQETSCDFEGGQAAYYYMVNGVYPDWFPVSTVSLQFKDLFNNCPEKVTLDMLKDIFLEWKISGESGESQYFKANLYGCSFSAEIVDGGFTSSSFGSFSSSGYNVLMTEIVYVGQEHKNTVNISPVKYYGDFLRQQKEENKKIEFISYTYTLEDITGDGKEEMLCRYMGVDDLKDRVYTISNGKVKLLYELKDNEVFSSYGKRGEDYVERIQVMSSNSNGDVERVRYYTLNEKGEKATLLTTIDMSYDIENGITNLKRDGKKLTYGSEEYDDAMFIAMYSGGYMYSHDYKSMINY